MSEQQNMSSIDQYVIDFVRKLRIEKALKQEDIAVIIGTQRTFIANVESSKNRAKQSDTY
ncbi:hypothetical protein GS399_19765 [Pedobacter sp. HMF7647]|uniref:Helix-turn-helix domain-containing protein n=1 Tax=Hufsiella arboris TaxID=2695275 RepID=A0A7K1YGN2_9SPHI|nr:hypothetical protein [Hufsiella arboris]MXV53209.1 hypothetical protein [Hufsiella arboris]